MAGHRQAVNKVHLPSRVYTYVRVMTIRMNVGTGRGRRSVTMSGLPGPLVLYVHGRGDAPSDPPGDLVGHFEWSLPLHAPRLDEDCFAHPALCQREVEHWLDRAALGVGHSYGGWLLLCAAQARLARGAACPRLLLLSSVLGPGSSRGLGFLPYRTRAIRRALGLHTADEPVFPPDMLTFVHAEGDEQCPVEPLHILERRFRVRIVPGGHRLEHPQAQAAVRAALFECNRTLATSVERDTGSTT